MTQPVPLLFWDVDTQVDFMHPAGKLFVPEADTLRPNLARLTIAARRHEVPVVSSADDHLLTDAEISDQPDFSVTYPPHCMSGTPGAERIPETRLTQPVDLGHEPVPEAELAKRLAAKAPQVLLKKHTVDVFTNPNTEAVLRYLDPQRIVVYGVALDICNRYAIEGLWQRGFHNLALVTDATKPINAEYGQQLLADWRARGIELLTTDEVLAQLPAAPA